jgi:hypothetical protein
LSRQNAGDVVGRAVGVLGIGEGDAVLALQPRQRSGVDLVVAVVMGDGKGDALPRLVAEVNGLSAVATSGPACGR